MGILKNHSPTSNLSYTCKNAPEYDSFDLENHRPRSVLGSLTIVLRSTQTLSTVQELHRHHGTTRVVFLYDIGTLQPPIGVKLPVNCFPNIN